MLVPESVFRSCSGEEERGSDGPKKGVREGGLRGFRGVKGRF